MFTRRIVCGVLRAAILGALLASSAVQSAEEARVKLALPSGSLSAALAELAEQTDLQLVYSGDLVRNFRFAGLNGNYTPEAALQKLLEGTGLTFRFTANNAVVIEKASSSDRRVLGPVRVEGINANSLGAINGSSDPTATEGTRSYTSSALSIGSKTPQSIKDTPQSVSVITQQRMRDQNIDDFDDAMKQATGITVLKGATSLDTSFYSRGYAITSIQMDGGAPLSTSFGYYPLIDMAQYDHVELLRGAAGLFNGYGDPSGTVNLVRKKPLDHSQVMIEGQAGSWQTYRAVIDVTSPLALEGKLRGRAVVSYKDNEYFYDLAKDNRTLAYGILEYDLSPSTLLSTGVSFTRQDSLPWVQGVPRFLNGDDLQLPRSVCLCFAWNRWDFDTTEVFARAEQLVGDDWRVALNVTKNRQESSAKLGFSNGPVNPVTRNGPMLSGSTNDYASDQLSFELSAAGTFELFGHRQEILFGVSRADTDGGGRATYAALISSSASSPYTPYPGAPAGVPAIDVFQFDPRNPLYSEPRNAQPSVYYRESGQTQSLAYLNARLTLIDGLHLVTGVRYSRFESSQVRDSLCTFAGQTSCVGKSIGDAYSTSKTGSDGDNISWPPSVSLSYDVVPTVTLYAGYADIYTDQSNMVDRDLNPIDPVTGFTLETGVKWESEDRRLNASLAAYHTKKDNYGLEITNPRYTDNEGNVYSGRPGITNGALEAGGSVRCCFRNDPNRSEISDGVDLELGGEVLPNWQVSLGYAWNENKYDRPGNSTDGEALISRAPEHLLKFWSTYAFRNGWLDRLKVGGGFNAQTDAYEAGTACAQFSAPNAQGSVTCLANVPYDYTQKGYAIFAARMNYDLNENWSVALNGENLTDKRYYQTMGTSSFGNWYGEPRSYMLTLRGQF